VQAIETIYYPSPLGTLKITGSDEHLTELMFESTQKNGQVESQTGFPAPVSALLSNVITQLDKYFSGGDLYFQLPLCQEGTLFQQRVWSELCKIKPGTTISYLQLSKNIGDTKAIRAVGTANGKNNIAIIVPCHRVIGSSGKLVGYGGDLWRKQWLLNHEAKFCNGVQSLF
jgi:methylated-DNA-[protein]-cysteine S-methyltransferase